MRRSLLIGIAAIALSGCQTTGLGSSTPTYQTFQGKFIDTPKVREAAAKPAMERRAGAGPATPLNAGAVRALSGTPDILSRSVYLDSAGIVDSDPLYAYLYDVLHQVLSDWPGEKPEIKIWVRASESFVPHAAVGNDIFLSIGALTQLENEHQLAGVLAHEAAHILLNHFDRERAMEGQRKTISAASSMVILGAGIADTKMQKTGGGDVQFVSKGDKDNAELALTGLAAGLVLMEFTDTLIDPSWNRDQENEADLLAVDLMVKANYDPAAYSVVLQKLATLETERKTKFQSLQESLGPALLASMSSFDVNQIKNDLTGMGLMAGFSLFSDWRDEQRLRYLSPEVRVKALADYIAREHLGRDRKAIATRPDRYQKAVRQGEVASVIENHRASIQAVEMLANGRAMEALALAEKGASGITKDAAHPRYVLSMVQSRLGRSKEALGNLVFAAQNELSPAIVYVDLAMRYSRDRQTEDALAVLAKGSERFGGEDRFLPTYITVYKAADKPEEAKAAYERCSKHESTDLRSQCTTAYGVKNEAGEGFGGLFNLLGS